jgi:4-phospho-D-threonate 3-dehydrogenase / 4-phospho-D-erythronate 3-dehydrogenase
MIRHTRIAITMGDPAGVGPELCLRLVTDKRLPQFCAPIIIGDDSVLRRVALEIDVPYPWQFGVLTPKSWANCYTQISLPVLIDLGNVERASQIEPGKVSAECGRAAYEYVKFAIDEALAGRVDAIATGPLHKEALHAAGVPHPGHTEILAEQTNTPRVCMMLTSDEITCSLATVHVGYRDVADLLTRDLVRETIEFTAAAMEQLRGRKPQLLVCGLNPHAGEHGLFGHHEEERVIAPAIEDARAKGINVRGPLPPDTAFLPKFRKGTDAYVCMYHDQGLIPLKALAFEDAVNVTLGLPIVRTSVDHGTAFDIAWKGVADVSSFVKAVQLAVKLGNARLQR